MKPLEQFTSHCSPVAEALMPRFGAVKHFAQRNKYDKKIEAGNIFFCNNMAKVDAIKHHVSLCDLKDFHIIIKLLDVKHAAPTCCGTWPRCLFILSLNIKLIPTRFILSMINNTSVPEPVP